MGKVQESSVHVGWFLAPFHVVTHRTGSLRSRVEGRPNHHRGGMSAFQAVDYAKKSRKLESTIHGVAVSSHVKVLATPGNQDAILAAWPYLQQLQEERSCQEYQLWD